MKSNKLSGPPSQHNFRCSRYFVCAIFNCDQSTTHFICNGAVNVHELVKYMTTTSTGRQGLGFALLLFTPLEGETH